MDSKLKQRLVGAVVLVALAVILVPMILEGPEDLGEPGSNLPPMPEAIIREPAEPLVLPPPEVTVPEPPEELAEAPTATEQAPAAPEPAGPSSPDPGTGQADAGAAPEPPLEAPAREPAGPAVAKGTTPPELTGWVVQLGSFSREANATALRDKVRALGYAAFVQAAKTPKGTTYRVRVGPELERARAEKLRDELKHKLGMAGMVAHHP